ncbi:hypothetical protein SLA2020_467960 [Shorea laevis]
MEKSKKHVEKAKCSRLINTKDILGIKVILESEDELEKVSKIIELQVGLTKECNRFSALVTVGEGIEDNAQQNALTYASDSDYVKLRSDCSPNKA